MEVPEEYYNKYKDLALESTYFTQKGYPIPPMTDKDQEDARRVYAMVENVDDNVNQLLKSLEENGLMENTLIFFLTDNGPQQRRYNAGFRDTKGTVMKAESGYQCLFIPDKTARNELVHRRRIWIYFPPSCKSAKSSITIK
ncbi:MAG: sulfatase-like hydrolase/transferase [Saprospiraceae bacterium]|nr:sulfatase-like hydrolase/transferase [Saprospiraceae bacterium]